MKLAHIYHNMGVIFQAGKDYAKAVDFVGLSAFSVREPNCTGFHDR